MSGSHSVQRAPSNSKWKIVVLIIVLVLVIAAVGFLLWQFLGGDLGGGQTAQVAPGIFTQIDAEYGNGKNVSGSLSITQGTQRPESIPETDDVVLLDIAWTGRKELSEPVYITVSDPSFTDGDGLSVHHYNSAAGQWEVLGTYTIANNSVTFLANSLSPFAFQVISAAPEVTPEPIVVTPVPTNTPEPTPVPTPAPIQVYDYGQHTSVQTSAFTLAKEMEDDAVYVMALVRDLPADALTSASDDGADAEDEDANDAEEADEEETGDGLTISYVDAPEATTGPAGDTAAEGGEAAAEPTVTPTATVLVNKDGTNFTLVDMPLVQADNGAWCLGGPVTDGMTWTANEDAYKDEHRFSLSNNGGYLNLGDDDQTMIMNDNSTWTRWLIENVTRADGTEVATLSYRDDDRYYVNQLGMAAETLPGVAVPASVTPEPLPDGTVAAEPTVAPTAIPGAPIYLGTTLPTDNSVTVENMQFTVSTDQNTGLQVVLFKQDTAATLPAGVVTSLEHNVIIPEINETTNLSTLVFMDNGKPLMLGTDYIISARVVNNDHVVVVIQFLGDYAGQIVRTYPGTTILTNDTPVATEVPQATPEPTAAPTYTGGGEGSNEPPPDYPETPPSTFSTPTDTVVEAPSGDSPT